MNNYHIPYYLPGGKYKAPPKYGRFKYDVLFYVKGDLFASTQVLANRLFGAKLQSQRIKQYLVYNALLPSRKVITIVKRVFDQEPLEPVDFTFKFLTNGHTNDNPDLHRSGTAR